MPLGVGYTEDIHPFERSDSSSLARLEVGRARQQLPPGPCPVLERQVPPDAVLVYGE